MINTDGQPTIANADLSRILGERGEAKVKIAGVWDIWLPSPTVEFNSRWQFLLRGFMLDGMYMSPVSEEFARAFAPADPYDRIEQVGSAEEAIRLNPDLTPVLLDENAETALRDFEHPEKALYLFGATSHPVVQEWDGLSVAVEYPGELSGYLQPDQAVAIVLYDRMMKSAE